MQSLKNVRDDDLLRQLSRLVGQSRRNEADVVAHIGEVEVRRLYAQEACSSMFEYCRRVLRLRENEAYLRITVARAAREYPALLDMLGDGRLHLNGIARLAPHLTRENVDEVLARAAGMSDRQVRELVCELAPRPDVAPMIRRLPRRPTPDNGTVAQLGAPRVESSSLNFDAQAPSTARQPVVAPLAPDRHLVRFTASTELRDKLERLQALMRSSLPDGDLARVIDIAVTEKLERLEARRFAKTEKPRKDLAETDTTPSSRHIPAAVRRAVHNRDGGRCTYRNPQGRRCEKRHDLEYHHKRPFARGGDHSLENVTLMCRAHNTLLAEQDYGQDVMARFRASAQRSPMVPVDAYGDRIVVQPRWSSPG